MLAMVFPGQGSQKKGMGSELFDSTPEYAAVERDVDALLGYSMRHLCINDPENRLKDTRYTQPSLFVVNALHYYRAVREGLRPSFLAGHSLGEYNALHAAGVFDFMTGLQLVKRRGELMAQAKNGGMAAIIGLDATKIGQVLNMNGLTSIDIANFNSPSQTVISGPIEDIGLANPLLETAGAQMCVTLPVSAAFHSRYVAGAGEEFRAFLAPLRFNAPNVPVIANVSARPYPIEDVSEQIKTLLVDQITQSVQWTQSVRYLLDQGVSDFKEAGPGNVLTRLIQQIRR